MVSDPLPYASPSTELPGYRGAWVCTLMWFGWLVVVHAWFFGGVAIGQRVEDQTMLFKPATGTDFWERWVIDAPIYFGFYALIGLILLTATLVALRRWCVECIVAVPLGLFAAFVSLVGMARAAEVVAP
ncbi:MAG: hypothetical protein AAF561_09405 [Planctomycetota bacterium]